MLTYIGKKKDLPKNTMSIEEVQESSRHEGDLRLGKEREAGC